MPNQRSHFQPRFLREIQLGLVVHGGVSLAIYIHGVCQEFYHAVRGRGIYKLVKALTDADLVVDTISGSSAGGINGVLLSYALTNSNEDELVDFSAFASIWRNSEDLLKLLRKPNLFRATTAESSFKTEDFYQRGLVAALAKGVNHKLPRPSQEWFSTNRELDLAIAGTDYLGKIDLSVDDTGLKFGSKNHHALFHLKHRQGRKEPFNPHYRDPNLPRTADDTYQALAKLCQIAAGTPGIFPLVEVDLEDGGNLVDRQLKTWGKLEQGYFLNLLPDRGNKLYFLDGGLLDNAPLTCLMKEAYYRLPTRSSNRKLFYIDTHSEYSRERVPLGRRKKSGAGKILQAAVFSIAIHQSIANDLRAINEHNHKVRRYQTLIDRAQFAVDSQRVLAGEERTQSQIYLRGRLFDFRDRNLPLLLHSDLGSQNSQYSVVLDKIRHVLTDKLTTNQDRKHYHKLLQRFESQVIDLDVEYSIRQHFYLVHEIGDMLNTTIDWNTRQQLQNLSRQLNCSIKLLEVVRASIELLLSDRSVSNYFYYLINQESSDRRLRALVHELIFRLHRFLLDETRFHTFIPNDVSRHLETVPVYFWLDLPELAAKDDSDRWLSQTQISSIFAQLKQRITDLHHSNDLHRLIWMDRQLEYDNDDNKSFPSILKQINLASEVLIERSANQYTFRLLKKWRTFSYLDRELYPFEYLTSLSQKELIYPIGISPDNARLGVSNGKNSQDKLGADKLYNIGGFFKKSWRSNDLLWGRLDGLNRILEGIITPDSVAAFAGFVYRESALTNRSQANYLDWLITESLPHLSGIERQVISQHLHRLAQPKLRIDRVELRQILADIVLAGQREILTSDVHSVIEGMDEQQGWWRLPTTQSSSENWIANTINPQPPSLVPTPNLNTIGRIIQQSLTNLAAQQKNFFRHQYRIGVDKLWENMPLVTLIGLGTRIVLFLRNLLVRVIGTSSRNQTMRHPLYHWLDGTLQSLYWWLQGGSIKLGAVHRRPRIILLQSLSMVTVIVGIVLAFLLSPLWLLLALPGATIGWFLQTMRLKRLTGVKSSPFLPQSRDKS